MTEGFTKVNLAAVEDAAPANGFGDRWEARVAREALGAERTGVTHFRLLPGKRSPFTHRHAEAEELYVVLSGSGRAKLDGELLDLEPLDAIRVAPRTARAFEAGPDGLELLAVGAHHPGDGEPVEDAWTAWSRLRVRAPNARDENRARPSPPAKRRRRSADYLLALGESLSGVASGGRARPASGGHPRGGAAVASPRPTGTGRVRTRRTDCPCRRLNSMG
jgi:uncharacterized cupin superfamily protein